MRKRKGSRLFSHSLDALFSIWVLLLAHFTAGCGAPGEPQPPSPPIPAAIADLTAHQQGNGVQLVFTMPGRTTNGERLTEPPATEIFRGTLKSDGKADNRSFYLVYTIPGALADTYTAQGKIRFTDPIAPEQLRTRSGLQLAYRVRTRASKKKDSADSNTVMVTLYAVAEKIPKVTANVTQNAIELTWPIPALSDASSGESLAGYHVYRGELDSDAALTSTDDLSQAKWKNPPLLLAPTQGNSYNDTFFDFGRTYVYLVRSVVIAQGSPIESDDSTPTMLTPRDTFPTAAPQNLVAAVLPSANGTRAVDLSWSINVEPDLAGYRIYRSESDSDRGALLSTELLLSPAYRDLSAESGHRYWYTATAVDRAGNESRGSDQILVDLTQPLP